MPDLADGEQVEMKGSGKKPYIIKNVGGVYSCSCPAWRNQSVAIDARTCKHIRKLRGEDAETTRIGTQLSKPTAVKKATAPALQLAESWTEDIDPTGWLMSEKLDGVRAYWNGTDFISRLGNTYQAPDWFKAQLPKVELDGELWMDRGLFQATVSIVRSQNNPDRWRNITYVVFDYLSLPDEWFASRYTELMQLYANAPNANNWRILPQEFCKNKAHLKKTLKLYQSLKAEGLMLHHPKALIVPGRTSQLLKVKTTISDECTVIAYEPGKGRHKGRLGALCVKTANGIQFSLGSGFSDAQRENPPPLGSVVTYKYQELTSNGVPRFPVFVGIRDYE